MEDFGYTEAAFNRCKTPWSQSEQGIFSEPASAESPLAHLLALRRSAVFKNTAWGYRANGGFGVKLFSIFYIFKTCYGF